MNEWLKWSNYYHYSCSVKQACLTEAMRDAISIAYVYMSIYAIHGVEAVSIRDDTIDNQLDMFLWPKRYSDSDMGNAAESACDDNMCAYSQKESFAEEDHTLREDKAAGGDLGSKCSEYE